jgi:hypothetical protein
MMKKRNLIYLVGGASAVLLSAGLWAQDPEENSPAGGPRPGWQHLALESPGAGVTGSPDLARKINRLGDEGWELVDVEAIHTAGSTTKTVYFFKRPK